VYGSIVTVADRFPCRPELPHETSVIWVANRSGHSDAPVEWRVDEKSIHP
jgi:hypothetical protein